MWYLNYIINQKNVPAIISDTLANIPASAANGSLFVSTDTFALYRWSGATWDLIGGPGTGTITGSGTINRVPKFSSGTNIIADSQIFDNGTTVAIGNTNPSAIYKFLVQGNSRFTGTLSINESVLGSLNSSNLYWGNANFQNFVNGFDNIGIGNLVFRNLTTAIQNTAIGAIAMNFATTASYCTAIGYGALRSNLTGEYNTAIGSFAMFQSTGVRNTAVGSLSLGNSSASSDNIAIGYSALDSLQISTGKNTAIGNNALSSISTGSDNTAIGYEAGFYIVGSSGPVQTNNNSVFIGNNTKASANGNTNEIVIGFNADGNGSNTVTIGNSSITNTYLQGIINGTSLLMSGSANFATISGNVGIGVTNPKTKLEIIGNNGNIRIYGEAGVAGNNISSNVYYDGVNWLRDDNLFGAAAILLNPIGTVNFYTTSLNTGFPTEAGRFTANQNLLIATTADNLVDKLQVAGSLSATGTIRGTLDGAQFRISGGGTDAGIYMSNSNNKLRLARWADGGGFMDLDVSNGSLLVQNSIQTGAPSGGTAAAWKLGSYNAALLSITTGYLEVDVNGITYKLALVN